MLINGCCRYWQQPHGRHDRFRGCRCWGVPEEVSIPIKWLLLRQEPFSYPHPRLCGYRKMAKIVSPPSVVEDFQSFLDDIYGRYDVDWKMMILTPKLIKVDPLEWISAVNYSLAHKRRLEKIWGSDIIITGCGQKIFVHICPQNRVNRLKTDFQKTINLW